MSATKCNYLLSWSDRVGPVPGGEVHPGASGGPDGSGIREIGSSGFLESGDFRICNIKNTKNMFLFLCFMLRKNATHSCTGCCTPRERVLPKPIGYAY